jgi:membrane-bound serine protease (ClpP class)
MKYLYLLPLLLFSFAGLAKEQSDKILLIDIKQQIDPRVNRYTELAFQKAEQIKAKAIIIEMNTYGGLVDDADKIRKRILDAKMPVYVFINNNAASAGALISIACDSIYMIAGANIGAATVVNQTGEAAPDKFQSYMRSMMRSTAEANGRNPKIAEGMVDQNLPADSVKEEGKVITFTTSEAIKNGFCEAELKSIEELIKRVGLEGIEIEKFELSASERIIAHFLNPYISGLLILLIMGGIYFELQTPGVGFPGIAALIGIVLYFVPYYLNGLAENWEIILFVIGVGLLITEIFVIPGFGIFGITGIIVVISSLILVMLNNDVFDFTYVPDTALNDALGVTFISLCGGTLLIIFGARRFLESNAFKKIALTNTLGKEEGYVSPDIAKNMVGMEGKALTILRPSGRVEIEGEIYDAVTRGEFIERNTAIKVIEQIGATLKVVSV